MQLLVQSERATSVSIYEGKLSYFDQLQQCRIVLQRLLDINLGQGVDRWVFFVGCRRRDTLGGSHRFLFRLFAGGNGSCLFIFIGGKMWFEFHGSSSGVEGGMLPARPLTGSLPGVR
jgi:hypothetical protein